MNTIKFTNSFYDFERVFGSLLLYFLKSKSVCSGKAINSQLLVLQYVGQFVCPKQFVICNLCICKHNDIV